MSRLYLGSTTHRTSLPGAVLGTALGALLTRRPAEEGAGARGRDRAGGAG